MAGLVLSLVNSALKKKKKSFQHRFDISTSIQRSPYIIIIQSHLLLALKNMAGKEKSLRRSKKRCVGTESVTMKRLREDLSKVNENFSKVWQEIAAVRDRLDTIHLSYSPSTCCEEPSDYMQRLREALPPPDISIVPIPLSSQRVDSILPSFETCLSRRVGNRIREAHFKKWMEFTRRDQCKFTVYFSAGKFVHFLFAFKDAVMSSFIVCIRRIGSPCIYS